MKYFLPPALIICCCLTAVCQPAPKPFGPLPSERQLKWQETEMYCIIHFGPDTYTNKEWGYGDEDPKIFDPTQFSAMQIVGAAKAAGLRVLWLWPNTMMVFACGRRKPRSIIFPKVPTKTAKAIFYRNTATPAISWA